MKTISLVLTSLLLLTSAPLQADDLQDLKGAFEQALDRIGGKDLDAFLDSWHAEAVFFGRNRLFAVDRAGDPARWRQLFDEFFARISSATVTKADVKYRIIGDTGLIWGVTRISVDMRQGAGSSRDTRLTAVFTKTADGWKIVHWNDSLMPEGQRPLVP